MMVKEDNKWWLPAGGAARKVCARCLREKSLEEFVICNTTPKKIHRKRFCKLCYTAMSKERQVIKLTAPPRRTSCDLCGKESKTVMDHCHEKLVFRGWLCNECNTGLGKFHENPELLRKAITYLSIESVV